MNGAGESQKKWRQQVRAHYDISARTYARVWDSPSASGESLRLRRHAVLALLDEAQCPLRDLLDVGCGTGEMVEPVHARGSRFWGVDLSLGMLTQARHRHPAEHDSRFVAADAMCLPYLDQTFDAVVAMGVVEYTLDPVASLSEMARLLRPGGVLVFTLPHHWSPFSLWLGYVYLRLVALARPWYRRMGGRLKPPQPKDRSGVRKQYKYDEQWSGAHLPGYLVVEVVQFSVLRVIPTPFDLLLPRLDVALIRRLERMRSGPLRRLGTVLVVRAHKQATSPRSGR